MNTRELRIGNLVLINGQLVVVESIDKHGINLYNGAYDGDSLGISCKYESDNIQGVSFDEKILIRLGFNQLDDKYFLLYAGNLNIRCLYTYSGGSWFIDLEEERLSLRFVHQLQNLYFALVGEELVLQD